MLDTLSRVRDDAHKESSAELSRVLEPLQEFARDNRICVLVTHHTGKQGDHQAADPFDSIRGSTAIRATARGALIITPQDGCYRLLSENGHTERLDVRMRINPQTWEWNLLGRREPRVDGDMKQQILDHLNLVGSATIPEIAAELQFKADSVKSILYRLQKDDLVTKTGGKGRQKAVYSRSGNLREQLETLLPHGNPDGVRDRDVVVTNNICETFAEKVCTESESMQNSAYFAISDPTHPKLLLQGYNPDSVSVSSGNKGDQVLPLVPLKIGDVCRYIGSDRGINTLKGLYQLHVVDLDETDAGAPAAIVKASTWRVTRSIPWADLKVVEAQDDAN